MRNLRRAVALAASSVVVISAAHTASAQAAPPVADPRPADDAAAWLTGELTNGLMYDEQFQSNNYGLTIDAALALDEVGGHRAALNDIRDAMATNVERYITGKDFGSPDDRYAGSTAKSLVLAQVVGADETDFGGVNLVRRMKALTLSGGATDGRIKDDSEFGDFSNAFGQAFAARGLHASGVAVAKAEQVTGFLLKQQCNAGFFRLNFAAESAAKQACDQAAPSQRQPDPDATSVAVLSLLGQRGEPRVDAAVADATSWLLAQQRPNGSFGGGPSTESPNSNSTGLAGWALGSVGRKAAARRAATWIRGKQAHDAPCCPTALSSETGAVAYDGAALAAGKRDGITTESTDQWRRATAQAAGALTWATQSAGSIELSGFGEFRGEDVRKGADTFRVR